MVNQSLNIKFAIAYFKTIFLIHLTSITTCNCERYFFIKIYLENEPITINDH